VIGGRCRLGSQEFGLGLEVAGLAQPLDRALRQAVTAQLMRVELVRQAAEAPPPEAPDMFGTHIDGTTGEWALLELPYPVELLRRYGNRTIAPEDVAALDADLSREVRAAAFPKPRALAVQDEALSSLRARLVLSAEPKAILQFVYNGVAVEDSALRAEQATVRHMNGDIVYEIRRDREAERRLRTQLDEVLAETPRTGEAWLGLMMNAVPPTLASRTASLRLATGMRMCAGINRTMRRGRTVRIHRTKRIRRTARIGHSQPAGQANGSI